MSKSAIYVASINQVNVASGSTLSLGTVIRRFGCNCHLSGDGIMLSGQGYYKVVGTFTVAPTDDALTTITAYQDGVAISGAFSSETINANDVANITLEFLVRQTCCDTNSILTFVLSGTTSVVQNVAVVVEKI